MIDVILILVLAQTENCPEGIVSVENNAVKETSVKTLGFEYPPKRLPIAFKRPKSLHLCTQGDIKVREEPIR